MDCGVRLKNVSLEYHLFHDKTNNLKEWIISSLTGRSFVKKKSEKFLALNNINLEIKKNDRLGIVGLNGAGKSSLLKIISGIFKPTYGTVEVNGSIQPLIEIGAGFDPEMTGRENIYLNGYMLGFTKKEISEVEKDIINFTELADFIDVPIKYYSSGMSVRLAFTIATSIKPEILVFDEMLAAGDAAFIQKAQKRLDSLIDQAKMMIIVSHDLSFINANCSRLIILDKGSVIFDGETKAGLDQYYKLVQSKG